MAIATSGPVAASRAGAGTGSGASCTSIRASSASASPPPSRPARSEISTVSPGAATRAIPQKPLLYPCSSGSSDAGSVPAGSANGSTPGCSARKTSRRGMPCAATGCVSPSTTRSSDSIRASGDRHQPPTNSAVPPPTRTAAGSGASRLTRRVGLPISRPGRAGSPCRGRARACRARRRPRRRTRARSGRSPGRRPPASCRRPSS